MPASTPLCAHCGRACRPDWIYCRACADDEGSAATVARIERTIAQHQRQLRRRWHIDPWAQRSGVTHVLKEPR